MSTKLLMAIAVAGTALASLAGPAVAQTMPKVVIGMSGWTGFAPLSLAEKAELFKKQGVDVEIKFIPQKDRHLAMAAGSVQAIATTIDTMVVYAASGVALTQVLLLDKSNGGDGIAAKPEIKTIADLKGKTIAVDGVGTTPYFMLAYILQKNGMTMKDVKPQTLAPSPAATAFIAGQFDAAATYEPYMSQVRDMKEGGKILVTTVDYPVVVDTLAFPPEFIAKNPKTVSAVIAGYFAALEMIKAEPAKSHEIMGAVVKQSGEQFAGSAKFIQWQDKAANQAYFGAPMNDFLKVATDLQKEAGVIKESPDLAKLVDASFIK